MNGHRLYVIAVSENPRTPVGSLVYLATRTITWVGATERPDGSIGDLTAIRADHVCQRCLPGEVTYANHDCPNVPPPEQWSPHPDQLDLLTGLEAS